MRAEPDPTPYWWVAAPLDVTPAAPLPERTDVAVIGSGYAGLAAAIELARAGRSVNVLEKDRPGEGASSRNGGIASGNIRMSLGAMIERFGLERALAVYREGKSAREDLLRFLDEERIDCDFHLGGRFTGALQPAHYDAMGREADLLQSHLGIEAYTVPRSQQHAEIGSDLYHGGMVRPDIGGLHPGRLHRGMLERALAAGSAVHARTPVLGVERNAFGFTVVTGHGRLQAHDVIVATNGYSGPAVPWLRRRIVPVASQMIATAPVPDTLMAQLMPRRRMFGESRRIFHYFRPSPDGRRILLGGRRATLHADARSERRHLYRALVEIFPELRGIALTHTWWGYTGHTFELLPRLTVHDGVHYATGFCGSGVVWARWLGRKAALRVLDRAGAASALESPPLSTRPLYWGRPWFLPPAIAWFALQDRLGR